MNERWEMKEIKLGERFPEAPNPCPHYVFASVNGKQPSGADYALEVLYIDVYNTKPSGKAGADVAKEILRILNRYFKFVGDIAFAESEAKKEQARKEVTEHLRALGYQMPAESRSSEPKPSKVRQGG